MRDTDIGIITLLLVGLLAGCGPSVNTEEMTADLLAGDLAAAGSAARSAHEARPSDPVPAFVSGLCAYLEGDRELLDAARRDATETPEHRAAVAAWIDGLTSRGDWPPEPRLALLLPALAAHLKDDRDGAEQILKAAIENTEDPDLIGYLQANLASLDPDNHVISVIVSDNPLTYSGNMQLAGQVWVPADEGFQITGGTLLTTFQQIHPVSAEIDAHSEFRGTFGGWAHVHDAAHAGDEVVTWAALVTAGTLYFESDGFESGEEGERSWKSLADLQPLPAGAEPHLHLKVDAQFDTEPADFLGRFQRVALGEGQAFPVTMVPHYRYPGGTSFQMASGTEFEMQSRHFSGSGGVTFFGGGAMINQVDNARVYGPVHHVVRF
jgi:hypothetical protein